METALDAGTGRASVTKQYFLLLIVLIVGLVGGYLGGEAGRGRLQLPDSLRASVIFSSNSAHGDAMGLFPDGTDAEGGGDEPLSTLFSSLLHDFNAHKRTASELAQMLAEEAEARLEQAIASGEAQPPEGSEITVWEPFNVTHDFLSRGTDPQILRDLGPWAARGFTYAQLLATKAGRAGAGLAPNPLSDRPRGLFTCAVLGGVPYFLTHEVKAMLAGYYAPTLVKIRAFLVMLQGVTMGSEASFVGVDVTPDVLLVWHVDPYPLLAGKPTQPPVPVPDAPPDMFAPRGSRGGGNGSVVVHPVTSDALDASPLSIPPAPPGLSPLLALCKTPGHWDALYPNMYFGSPAKWDSQTARLARGNDGNPWGRRTPKLWWRGTLGDMWPGGKARADTVGTFASESWADMAFVDPEDRAAAVLASWATQPWGPSLPPGLASVRTGTRHTVPMDRVARYKFALHLPGFFQGTYSRTLQSLLWTGATIFLYDSPYSEFYYHRLKPWLHYVPVNGTNLPDRVAWAQANPLDAWRLAVVGARTARRHLSGSAVGEYWRALLRTWARLQRFTPRAVVRPESLCTCWHADGRVGGGGNSDDRPPRWVLPGARHCGLLCHSVELQNDPEYRKPWLGVSESPTPSPTAKLAGRREDAEESLYDEGWLLPPTVSVKKKDKGRRKKRRGRGLSDSPPQDLGEGSDFSSDALSNDSKHDATSIEAPLVGTQDGGAVQ